MLIRSNASTPRALGLLLLCVLASVAGAGAAEAAAKKVKVFILAGQSNMEGPASISTFDYIGDDPATAPLLKMMRGSDGKPTVCDGVWISYLTGAGADNFTLNGKLTAGYGSMWGQDRTKPGTNIGPEFTFGLRMDAAFEEPVLLIKTAWGGKSLNTDFRPPSAGPYVLPKETQELWDQHPQGAHGIPKAEDRPKIAAEKAAATGVYYRLMIEHVKKVLADPKQVVPDYDPAQGYEIAGFAWLQGWNDAVDGQTYPRRHQPDGYAMYSKLLAAFIRDVRKDLDASKMPFVIGVMGVGGLRNPSPATVAFRSAMAAPAHMPEFKGNVTAVQTAPFWPDELTDIEAKRVRVGQMRQALNSKHKDHANADGKMTDEQKNEFMKKFEADLISPAEAATWKRGVSNAGYHYLGCAKIFALMGKHFAEANLALLGADHDSAATTDTTAATTDTTAATTHTTASTTDKTLVAWVAPANLDQQGGSVLTIQEHTRFDAIVLGERARGKWMAGSEGFSRTQTNQDANATETAGPDALVQLAIVYQGNTVRLYRNGEVYAEYTAQNIDLLKGSDHIAVFGLRHLGAGSGTPFAGAIEDARIYSRPLSAEEIGSLKPDVASDIAPLAWWDFEGEAARDRAGHFAHHKAETGATIKDGRLVLDGKGSLMAACSDRVLKLAAGEGTPHWPEQPPASWMTFHLAHPGPGGAHPGDPNCIFDYKGKVHLHYIYGTPAGPAFSHVSSDDMVHWKWHDTVLAPPTTGHGMYSGTGFYTKEGRPAIIYHAAGKGRNVVHYPADDMFDSWTKPEIVMPKKADGSVPEMRHWDPDCWLMNDTYYAYSGGQNPQLMKSPDLKNWAYLGDLLHPDYPSDLGIPKAEDISCGNMFKIGDKWMLLCISHSKGARYYLGDFKDEKYLPTFHAMMSFGSNTFFAPESVLTRDGRRVMWAWLMGLPISPTGVQSLPRELELPADGVLRIKPLRELASLRSDEHQETDVVVGTDAPHRLKDIRGDALEMEVTFKAPAAKEFGLDVLCDKSGANGLRVAYAADTKTLKVGAAAAPFELNKAEDLVLRVFIDRNLVEVFANDRQAVVAANPLVPGNLDVSLFSKGGDVVAKSVKAWKIKSIYPAGKTEEKRQAREDPVKGTSSADGTMLRDKTLVAWVRLADLVQTGSGVLAIQDGDEFDAITFGERAAGRWMAGSSGFSRTQSPAAQQSLAQEAATPDQWLQVAVVYRGKQIEIWRDGRCYASYEATNQQTYPAKSDVYLGLRCLVAQSHGYLKGAIDEARIYDTALGGEALSQLKPGVLTVPKPLGWWIFDGGSVKDGMGHYPDARLIGTAKIKNGALVLDGQGYAHVSCRPSTVQAGFFTPSRKGQIWDTWAYFHEGRYYLYYLAGNFNRWDGHELALSDDGVHWKEQGVLIKPRAGVTWMGTGHIWKSPDFGRNHTWVINYSEWFGDKQDIMFATSTNLLDWTKVDEKHRFVQDTRWYKEKGRWDCIDTVVRPDGSLYGYFTADPDPAKVKYRPCGFGFAESKDGITWTALPPIEGDVSGEFGGIQKIGDKYYIIISEGRVAVGDKPEGPFLAQKKNSNVFGAGCDIYFPRFFHSAPGGPLVNHFYTSGAVSAAPFKDIEIDREGILRLKWWKNNDAMKANPVKVSLVPAGEGYFPSLKMLDWKPDPARTTVIEGTIVRASAGTGDASSPRIFFDQGGGKGQCLVFSKDKVTFGNIDAAGGEFKPAQTSARGMEIGAEARFRLLIRENMIELYVNDYLMNLKRVSYNGRIGFMADDRQGGFKDISVWQSK